MRGRKNREVNIFSASVVDLFASGLGVFLIVSIIALVNQKKENMKSLAEQSGKQSSLVESEEVGELKSEIQKLQDQIFNLKAKDITKDSENIKMSNEESKLDERIEKAKLINDNQGLSKKVIELQSTIVKLNYKINEMKDIIGQSYKNAKSGEKGIGINYNQYEVGSKIRLKNVQFYPGTDRPIEPYASHEIESFARYMVAHPKVYIEVSGHIFETKKAIEAGNADDIYNLSGARARRVCSILNKFGVSEKRMNCVGYGAQRYIYLTDDQYSVEAQLNRRVEIEILSK